LANLHDFLARAMRHPLARIGFFFALTSAYLFAPFLKEPEREEDFDPEKAWPTKHIACFFMRDVSFSVSAKDYDAIEETIHNVLRAKYDSILYGLFAGDTFPYVLDQFSRIDSARRSRDLLGSATLVDHRRTDFAQLFSRLAEVFSKPLPEPADDSIDLVVVLSDGMPDRETHDQKCPDPTKDSLLIDERTANSYDGLLQTAAASNRNLWVILVLNGGSAECADVVKSGWKESLNRNRLKITDKENMVKEILDITNRAPQGHLTPVRQMSSDFDRELKAATKTGEFSVSYIPWSFGEGGNGSEITVEAAKLIKDRDTQVAMLYPVSGRQVSAQDLDTRVKFKLASPAPESLYWKGPPLDIVFQLRGTPKLEEVQRYRVRLDTKPSGIVTAKEADVLGRASEPALAIWERTMQMRYAALAVLLIYAAVTTISLGYKNMWPWIVSLCFTAAFGVTVSVACACVSIFHHYLAWILPLLSIAVGLLIAILKRKEGDGKMRIEIEHIFLAAAELLTIVLAAKLEW